LEALTTAQESWESRICWRWVFINNLGNVVGELAYSNQVSTERRRWQCYRLLWNQGKGGYSEADECHDNDRIYKEIKFDPKY